MSTGVNFRLPDGMAKYYYTTTAPTIAPVGDGARSRPRRTGFARQDL